MNKQKELIRKRKQKKTQTRWLITGGVVLVLASISWLIFSNIKVDNPTARSISQLNTGDFHSLAFSPTEAETIFFGHHGGLMVSLNGGKDWKSTTLKNADAMALAIPQSNPQIMYAAGHDVFFKSTDAGETWVSVTTNLPGTDIHGFAVNPQNAEQVFANVGGFGIYTSQDGGVTWNLFSNSAPSSTFNLTVGKDGKSLYSAAGQAGFFESTDDGQTWQQLNASAVAGVYVPANNRIYISTYDSAPGLYYSDDNGLTWLSAGLNGTFLAIAVSPLDPNHIIVVNDAGKVFASQDAGISWTE